MRNHKGAVLSNSILRHPSIKQEVSQKVLSEYVSIMRKALILGYEWEVPTLGVMKIIKFNGTPKLKVTRQKSLRVRNVWYKLDFEPEVKARREKVTYNMLPSFKAEVKELLKNKLIDYRFIS